MLRWVGRTPDEHLDGLAALLNRMSDAPVGELEWGDESWGPERIRASERGSELGGMRTYTVVARHDTSGTLAGLTTVAVSDEQPGGPARAPPSCCRPTAGTGWGCW